jgi:hypothetical protein
VRTALGTLPWVEQGTIQTDVNTREVRFAVKDAGQFNEGAVRKALQAQGFAEVVVKAAPIAG